MTHDDSPLDLSFFLLGFQIFQVPHIEPFTGPGKRCSIMLRCSMTATRTWLFEKWPVEVHDLPVLMVMFHGKKNP
jgi:hypothetical protein